MTKRSNQKGVALILALISVLILSTVGVSIMFLGQSETWSGLNYRLMTQARYGAEAGLNSAANYLVNTYTAPSTALALSAYDLTKSPVQYNGGNVVLSTTSGSNYPDASVVSAFQSAAQGTLAAGNTTVNYTATATLMAMSQVTTAAGPVTIQTWSITADSAIGGVRNATEEVTGVIERQVTFAAAPAPGYGAFGTGNGCGSLTFSGGVNISSYDSRHPTISGGVVVPDLYGGNIGSNGNLNESGGAAVNGTFSTPRTGVGSCSAGDAWTDSGKATVTGCTASGTCVAGGLIQLSQTVTYASPALPTTLPPTSKLQITKTDTCATLGLSSSSCSGSAGNLILAPGSYGNISLSGGAQVTLAPGGNYAVNSITLSGNSALLAGSTNTSPVVVNVVGQGQSSPLDFSGGAVTNVNSSGVPVPINMQFLYAGTGNVKLSGGSQTAGTVYAPNAPISLSGGSQWYGSIIGSTITDSGGVSINYDRQLSGGGTTLVATVGNFMMDSFSWSRF